MAFDKVVDSVALDTELKNLADILREKSETTEELDFYAGDFSRVAESIEFIGIKYSNFTCGENYTGFEYNRPKTADARSLDKMLLNPSKTNGTQDGRMYAENRTALSSAFANMNTHDNGGYFIDIEEVYLPDNVTALLSTFLNCISLKKIYGSCTHITILDSTFRGCLELENIPDMPKLETIGNASFQNCYKLKEYSIPPKVKSIHSGAFTGCSNLLDIYCSFAEGAVANAPWGATNATIHYNTQFDEQGNIIE